MIIVRLAGGLGNQIFQFGAALLIAERNGISEIVLDSSCLQSYAAKHNFELNKVFDLNLAKPNISLRKSLLSKLRIPKLVPLAIKNYPFIGDKNWQFMKDKSNQRFNLLDGYFQWVLSQEDFNDMTSLLRKMLINPTQLSIAKNSCVIHIRGTDFISLGWADEQQKYFYQKAIEYLNRNFGITRFEICTDDMPFAKSILEDKNFSFNFAKRRLAEDFFLIANCSKRIISSSTFAFWASALGTNDNSVTIAQNFWFPGKPREIYLPGELQLNL